MLKTLKSLSILTSILLLIGLLANFAVDNPYVHRLLRANINQQLENYTHISVKFEAISAKFAPPGFDIYGIDIRYKKPDGSEQSLAQIAHAQVRVSILALLLSQPEILRLELNEPRFDIPQLKIAELIRTEKFPDWDKPRELASWPLDIETPFKSVTINNAALHYKLDAEVPGKSALLATQLEGLDLKWDFENWQNFTLKIHLDRGDLAVEGSEILRDLNLDLDLQHDRGITKAEKFSLNSQELKTSGNVKIDYETQRKVTRAPIQDPEAKQLKGLFLRINNQIETADIGILGRYLGVDQTQGKLEAQTEFHIHIPLDQRPLSWRIDGKTQSHAALLYGFKLLDSKIQFNITEEGMSFEKIEILKKQKLLANATGFIGFTADTPYNFDIQPKELPFADLMSILAIDDFDAISAKLSSSKIKLSGKAIPFNMQIGGSALFEQLSLPFVAGLPKRFPIAPNCLIDTSIKINAKLLEITRGQGQCWQEKSKIQPHGKDELSPIAIDGKFFFTTQEGLDIKIDSSKLNLKLSEHFTKLPSRGSARIQTRIRGPYDHIQIQGILDGQNLQVGGFELTKAVAQYQFDVDKSALSIKELRAELTDLGRLKLNEFHLLAKDSYPFSGRMKAENISPSFLSQGLKETFGLENFSVGIKNITGDLKGHLLEPFSYQGQLNFNLFDVQNAGEHLLTQATGQMIGAKNSWSLNDVYLRLMQIEARLAVNIKKHGSDKRGQTLLEKLGLSNSDRIEIHSNTIKPGLSSYRSNYVSEEINHLTSLPYVGQIFKEQRFGGQIQLETDLEGTIGHLQGRVEGSLEQPSIWGIPIASIDIAGFIDGSKLHIPELRHAGSGLVGRINIDFSRPGLPFDWYLYFNQLDIRALIGQFFAEDPRNFAYLSAEWTMRGQLSNFWSSQGEIALKSIRSKLFRDLGSRTSSIELNSDDPIRINISPKGWALVDKRQLKLEGEYFKLNFDAGNNRLPNQLDLSVNGSIKLDVLKNFSNFVESARGELVVEGHLRGSLSKPDLSIRLREKRLDPFNLKDWQPVSLGIVDYGPALNAMSMDVEIKSDRIVVNKMKATKGREGSLSVSGELSFGDREKNASKLDIQLDRVEFNRLLVPVLKTADLTVSGNLAVTGKQLPFNLKGDLTINRLQSIGSFDLRKQIVSSIYESRLSSKSSSKDKTAEIPMLNLDVGIEADSSILIKNKTLEAQISTDNFHVRGTEIEPLLSGQIIADRGTFNYRRNFKIDHAFITFEELVSPPNPRLDILGETTVSPYKVQVAVNGNLQTPRVQLTVDPANRDDGSPISNLDILLLISTGRIPEQANKTAEKASFNELVSFFAVFAEEPIEKLFDLSGQTVIREVYFDSYLSETEQRPITRVNFPIRLGDNLNAVFQVDDEAKTKVSLEYLISEGITVSGSLDKGNDRLNTTQKSLPADSVVDLKFRFGFD